jgi:hypothetical protein
MACYSFLFSVPFTIALDALKTVNLDPGKLVMLSFIAN